MNEETLAEDDAPRCKHCGRPLAENGRHAEGRQRGLNRCDSADSGLPYGYDAAPVGEPCSHGCLGYEPPCPGEREDVLEQAIRRIEGLRKQNPMNGDDGANWMLDKVITRLCESPYLEAVALEARTEHQERWNREYVEFRARDDRTPKEKP